jgi:hypothetical protein
MIPKHAHNIGSGVTKSTEQSLPGFDYRLFNENCNSSKPINVGSHFTGNT